MANIHPELTFPQIYVMEGGYSSYFQEVLKGKGKSYVKMDQMEFNEERRKCQSILDSLKRKKFF